MKRLFFIFVIAAIVLTGCSKNGGMTTEENTPKEVETKYFDFTVTEFVNKLYDEHGIDLTSIATVDNAEKGEKINSYTFKTENDTTETMVHYMVVCDITTNKVNHISFRFSKDFMGDIKSARTRFNYHVYAIAKIIQPNINTDEIHNSLSDVIKVGESETAIYIGDEFYLNANYGDYFNAVFLTKKEQ